jgi:hypothetical protein
MKEPKAKWTRKRKIPIQVYVSELEHAQLRKLITKRRSSVSALVRAWIRRAIAASAGANVAAPRDPRQAELF